MCRRHRGAATGIVGDDQGIREDKSPRERWASGPEGSTLTASARFRQRARGPTICSRTTRSMAPRVAIPTLRTTVARGIDRATTVVERPFGIAGSATRRRRFCPHPCRVAMTVITSLAALEGSRHGRAGGDLEVSGRVHFARSAV